MELIVIIAIVAGIGFLAYKQFAPKAAKVVTPEPTPEPTPAPAAKTTKAKAPAAKKTTTRKPRTPK